MLFRNATINPDLLSSEENRLLDEWASSVPGFVRDGCANPERYCAAPVRLLFVLKEVNGGQDWDLREYMNEGCRPQTWNVIARWIEGIFKIDHDFSWDEMQHDDDNRRKKYIPQVAAVNVKKTSGGSVADTYLINSSVENNKVFLKQQIQLYQADIIILCGTEEQYRTIINDKPHWQMTTRGIWYYIDDNNTIVISFSHPEARTKKSFLYYGLIDAVKEIANQG